MSDMNFFSSYNKKSEKKTREKSSVFINTIVILICLFIIGYGTFNFLAVRSLGREVAALSTQLETARKDPMIAQNMEKEKQITAMKEELSKVVALDKYVDDNDFVNEFLLEDIRVNTPPELFLRSMVMSREAIKIDGVSKDKGSIAQFQYNLRELEGLEKVFVSNIKEENEHYNFYLEIDLKEETADGAEAGKQ